MTANTAIDLTEVTYRTLMPSDTATVRDLHAGLGERDRYYRFFGPRPKNLDHVATQIAAHDPKHFAVGAFLGRWLIGVANYVVLEDPRCAEVTMIVAHEDQRSDIGTTLLAGLAQEARRYDIQRFVAEILSTNSTTMQLLMDADMPINAKCDNGVVSVVLELGPAQRR
ncbi:hypothetical protein ABIA39_003284 [Nocardia sp. GAS34]|uniref:GNAT family N-acetyltransferase n=1 Tax=unclassified Nocardia TaxID=2637762 RepID=UPI003D22177C